MVRGNGGHVVDRALYVHVQENLCHRTRPLLTHAFISNMERLVTYVSSHGSPPPMAGGSGGGLSATRSIGSGRTPPKKSPAKARSPAKRQEVSDTESGGEHNDEDEDQAVKRVSPSPSKRSRPARGESPPPKRVSPSQDRVSVDSSSEANVVLEEPRADNGNDSSSREGEEDEDEVVEIADDSDDELVTIGTASPPSERGALTISAPVGDSSSGASLGKDVKPRPKPNLATMVATRRPLAAVSPSSKGADSTCTPQSTSTPGSEGKATSASRSSPIVQEPAQSIASEPSDTVALSAPMGTKERTSIVIVGTLLSTPAAAAVQRLLRLSPLRCGEEMVHLEYTEVLSLPSSPGKLRPFTHLIVGDEALAPFAPGSVERFLVRRTPKYLAALSQGAWVLQEHWLLNCIARDELVAEAPYEITGDMSAKGGSRGNRLRVHDHESRYWLAGEVYSRPPTWKPLLGDFVVVVPPVECSAHKYDLAICEATGAEGIFPPQQALEAVKLAISSSKPLVVMMPSTTEKERGQLEALFWLAQAMGVPKAMAVRTRWVYHCLSECKVLPMEPHILNLPMTKKVSTFPSLAAVDVAHQLFDSATKVLHSGGVTVPSVDPSLIRGGAASMEAAYAVGVHRMAGSVI
jgi:hypothetical protein